MKSLVIKRVFRLIVICISLFAAMYSSGVYAINIVVCGAGIPACNSGLSSSCGLTGGNSCSDYGGINAIESTYGSGTGCPTTYCIYCGGGSCAYIPPAQTARASGFGGIAGATLLTTTDRTTLKTATTPHTLPAEASNSLAGKGYVLWVGGMRTVYGQWGNKLYGTANSGQSGASTSSTYSWQTSYMPQTACVSGTSASALFSVGEGGQVAFSSPLKAVYADEASGSPIYWSTYANQGAVAGYVNLENDYTTATGNGGNEQFGDVTSFYMIFCSPTGTENDYFDS